MALLVFSMFGLGLYMVELSYYDAWYKGSLDLHKSLGVIAFLLLAIRAFWRLVNVKPSFEGEGPSEVGFELSLAKWVHRVLYVLMFVLMFSGYLISTADGRGIDVFGLFDVYAIPVLVDNQEDVAGDIHYFLAWTLIVLVGLHALAAIKHHYLNKDNVLIRMLRPNK
jgi:cytochrome b561